jgi:major outer membrane protein
MKESMRILIRNTALLAVILWPNVGYCQDKGSVELGPSPGLFPPEDSATTLADLDNSNPFDLPRDPGWYVQHGVGLFKPHIKSRITSGAPLSPQFTAPVQLPMGGLLDWTGSPDLHLGYRFAASQDELHVRYQGVFSQGSQVSPGFDAFGSATLTGRLSANIVDLDYVSRELLYRAIMPNLTRDVDFRFGIRTATVFFDSRAVGHQILNEHMSNMFAGVGPRVGFDASRWVFGGLGFYFQSEGSALVGQVHQRFSETALVNGSRLIASSSTPYQSTGVGILALESGLRWVPRWNENLRLSIGYHWERWWNVGAADGSNAELTLQGIFFRGELRF